MTDGSNRDLHGNEASMDADRQTTQQSGKRRWLRIAGLMVLVVVALAGASAGSYVLGKNSRPSDREVARSTSAAVERAVARETRHQEHLRRQGPGRTEGS